MPKVSPLIRSFNAGVFSVLMEGRVDIDRYPASLRRLMNFIAAPQGPAIRRSGTYFVNTAYSDATKSVLVPFEFSKDQALILEFGANVIRLFDEDGPVTHDPVAITATNQANPFRFTSAALAASVGEQVALSGFAPQYNLNGVIGEVTAKVGDTYTLDVGYDPALPAPNLANAKAARVFKVDTAYTEADLQSLRTVQSVDVVYLFVDGKRPRTLSRYGAYDWRMADFEPFDGPYMDENESGVRITPSATGNAATNSTGTASDPNQGGATTNLAANAFDDDKDTYWQSGGADQKGVLEFAPTTPFACTGYVIYAARDNTSTSYTAKDYAPGNWTFEGYTGSAWVVLDAQADYVLYDGYRSAFFKLNNTTVYQKYRLNISQCTRNGTIKPRVARLILASEATNSITLTASAITGINNDRGFLATDIGRLIRVYGTDGMWRSLKITAVASTTQVTASLQSEPLANTDAMLKWRLGYWSDTSGWPTTAIFFEDRLWLAGSLEAPDLIAGSLVGAYNKFSQTDPTGEVLDESAVVVRLNARKLARVQWLATDEKGILIGTGSGEWVISAPDVSSGKAAITAKNIRARQSTERGSADLDAVKIDRQVLYVQRARRTLREFAYVYEVDGYKAPSMSQFASHLSAGNIRFAELDYTAEPHSIVWVRRDDGSVVGFTYNRDENVLGWHMHDFAGGVVESMAVIPAKSQIQDTLWLVVRREVDGVQKRYIERLTPFWDFGFTIEDAFFVDSGLRYEGDPSATVYGLTHLEGRDVVGLVDGVPFGPSPVSGGAVELPLEGSNVVVGLPYDSEGETSRLEAGAADGTAQGKNKRAHLLGVSVWDSAGGEVGVWNEDTNEPVYEPLPFNEAPYDQVEPVELHTEMVEVTPAPGYGKRGNVLFRQPGELPLPLNIICIMPQLHTQDR